MIRAIVDYSLLLNVIFILLLSWLVTFLILPRLANIASRIGLLDFPDSRKVHRSPKPLVGGIGMMIGISVSLLLSVSLSGFRGFYAGLLILAIFGFLDDFREIKPRLKFSAQLLASVFMIYFSHTVLTSFGNLFGFGNLDFGILAIPFTIFCTVGVINAINMIDGLDGLAGGVSLVAFSSFAILSFMSQQYELMMLCIVFSGSLLAFLWYNWYPAKIFMGDAGSLSLGFGLAFLSIAIAEKASGLIPPVSILFVLAVPIVDTLTIMIKRIIKGLNPFHPDKGHLHHILFRFGYDKQTTVKIIILLTAIFSIIGIAGTVWNIPEYYLFAFFLVYFFSYFIASFYIKEMLKYFRRRRNRISAMEMKVDQ